MGVKESMHNPSRPTPVLVCMLFVRYVPFSAKVKIPVALVAFFDVQWGRCLVYMEETGKVLCSAISKGHVSQRLLQSHIFQDLVLSESK